MIINSHCAIVASLIRIERFQKIYGNDSQQNRHFNRKMYTIICPLTKSHTKVETLSLQFGPRNYLNMEAFSLTHQLGNCKIQVHPIFLRHCVGICKRSNRRKKSYEFYRGSLIEIPGISLYCCEYEMKSN